MVSDTACVRRIIDRMIFVLCSAFPVGILHVLFNQDTPPIIYKTSDPIVITVGALRSPFGPVPISYEINDLFCPLLHSPPTSISPGQSLTGNIRLPSPYTFRIAESPSCNITCTKQYNDRQKKRLINLIDAAYRASFYLDNVPIGTLNMKATFLPYDGPVLKSTLCEIGSNLCGTTSNSLHFYVKSVTLPNEADAIRNARFVFVNPSLTQRVLVTSAACIGLSVLV
jgi:hypothetical protein